MHSDWNRNQCTLCEWKTFKGSEVSSDNDGRRQNTKMVNVRKYHALCRKSRWSGKHINPNIGIFIKYQEKLWWI